MASRSPSEWLRLAALYGGVVFLAALSRPRPGWIIAGLPWVLLGETLRIWSAGHLHKSRLLITSGPYRYTRNPLYLGRLLIFTGLALMARLPWNLNLLVLLGGYTVFFAYYLPRKERVEPVRLEAIHGQAYRRYFEAVPALLPALRPYPAPAGGWRWSRFARNREALMVAVLLLLIALLVYRTRP